MIPSKKGVEIMRILLAEDDNDLRKALKTILEKHNYEVDAVDNGDDAFLYANSVPYDGMICDVMMPKKNGFEVTQLLRHEQSTIPILMLTAKSETKDKITGLDAGADDYLAKPFDMTELLARLRAVIRRRQKNLMKIEYAGINLNPEDLSLNYNGNSRQLTARLYHLIEVFIRQPEVIIGQDSLIRKVWGWTEVDQASLWVYLSQVRKILQDMNIPVHLRSIRHLGYILEKN